MNTVATASPAARRLRAAACAFGLTCAGAAAQTCVPTPPGAVYWLAGERNYDDLAGYHNATFVAPGVGFAPGKVGSAIHFGGAIEDRLYTDTIYAEERAVRGAFTIELWARPEAALPDCAESNNGTCAAPMPWVLFPEHGANSAPPGEENLAAGIGVAIGTNGVCVGEHTVWLLPCLARVDMPIGDWVHVAVVVEDLTPHIWVDGSLVHTGTASDREFVFASWTVLGSVGIDGYGAYAGDIDELTLYDRALTAGEIGTLFGAGVDGKCKPDCAVDRHDDLWESALVTATTPLLSNRADCVFGAEDCSPESDSVLFADGMPDGTLQSIEWQTATPVTLGGLALHAYHDEANDTQRSFDHVRIQARPTGGTFATLYDADIALPYGQGADERQILKCLHLRPTHAQEFRAEFVQAGNNTSRGSRVVELDGIVYDPIFADDFEPD